MSDRNIQGKKEGNRKRVDRNFEQQKQRLSKPFACSFSTGSYTTLCSPGEVFEISATPARDCLRETEGRALVTTPLCFKCSRENQKNIRSAQLAENQMRKAASDAEQEGETREEKNKKYIKRNQKKHARGIHT